MGEKEKGDDALPEFDPRAWRPARIAGEVVVLLWLCGLTWRMRWPGTPGAGGTTDAFDAVTALFSGLALAGVIATLWLQRKEMASNDQKLQKQAERLDVQQNALVKMASALEGMVARVDRQTNLALLGAAYDQASRARKAGSPSRDVVKYFERVEKAYLTEIRLLLGTEDKE